MRENVLAIEYHPENGEVPWVVVSRGAVPIWMAYRTVGDAAKKLTDGEYVNFVSALAARQ